MIHRGLSLLGFMDSSSVAPYLANIAGQPFAKSDLWKDAWQAATEFPKGVEGLVPGRPGMQEIPEEYHAHVLKISSEPAFRARHHHGNWAFRMVEIRPLVCPAIHVNLDAVAQFQQIASGHDPMALLELCLPKEPTKSAIHIEQSASLVVTSLQTNNLGAHLAIEPPNPWVQMVVPRLVHAVMYQGRYLLTDGFHRALALLREGFEYIPALVVDPPQGMVGPAVIRAHWKFNPHVLLAEVPPMMAHFLSKGSVEVPLLPAVKVLRITGEEFVVRVQDMPESSGKSEHV